jgi:probable HAF family extracellular repeat protein
VSIGCGDRTVPTGPALDDQPALAAGGGEKMIVKSIVGLEPFFDAAANLSFALQVSDLGQVVGTSSNSADDLQAVIWEGSIFASPLGSTASSASGIMPDGSVIVGTVAGSPVRWVKVNGVWTELALPGPAHPCFTVVIGGDGTIAGTCEVGKGPPSVVVWRNGVLTELGTGSAKAVNANQQVLVEVGDESFIWDLRTSPMTITPLGSLGGTRTSAFDINDLGQVVGSSQNAAGVFRPFLWTAKKGMVDLGTIGGDRGTASAINNAGQIVGLSDLPGTTLAHATYWYKGKIHDLGVLSGYESSSATDINGSGQIVGGSAIGSNHRATLWTLDAR